MNLAEDAAKFWPSFQWRYLLLLPVAAAIVHLIATFMAMSDTRGSAYSHLASLPLNVMKLQPPIAPGQQALPFLSPDARYAICRFSARQGPVDVKASLPGLGWTLGVYYPDGSTGYFAAGAAGRTTSVAITLLPGDDRFLGLSPQALGKPAAGMHKCPTACNKLRSKHQRKISLPFLPGWQRKLCRLIRSQSACVNMIST